MLPRSDKGKARLISFLWVLVADVLVVQLNLAHFKTNDDTAMMYRILGEWIASRPSIFNLFSHIDVSQFLIFLYELDPHIPWYGLYLLLPISILHYLILYYGLLHHGQRALLYYIPYFVAGGYILFLELQFTIAASAWTLSGLILLVQQVRKDQWGWPTWIGLLFVLIGCLVRFKQSAIILTSFLVLIFFFSWNYRHQTRIWRGAILFLAALVAALLLQYRQVNAFKSHPDWKGVMEYNAYRADMYDFKALEAIDPLDQQAVLNRIGWTPNDYNMFMHMFFWDTERFDRDALKAVSEEAPVLRKPLDPSFIRLLFSSMVRPYSLVVFVMLLWTYFESRRLRREKGILLYGLGIIIALLTLSAGLLKPAPERVTYGLFLSAFVASMIFIRPRPINRLKGNLWLPITVLAVLTITNGQDSYRKYRDTRNSVASLVSLNDFLGNEKDPIVVIWSSNFPWGGITPFAPKNELPQGQALVLGSLQQTPVYRHHAESLGILDLYEALAIRESVYLSVQRVSKSKYIQLIRTYIQEHYGFETEWKTAFNYGKYTLIKGCHVPPPTDNSHNLPSTQEPGRTNTNAHSLPDQQDDLAR